MTVFIWLHWVNQKRHGWLIFNTWAYILSRRLFRQNYCEWIAGEKVRKQEFWIRQCREWQMKVGMMERPLFREFTQDFAVGLIPVWLILVGLPRPIIIKDKNTCGSSQPLWPFCLICLYREGEKKNTITFFICCALKNLASLGCYMQLHALHCGSVGSVGSVGAADGSVPMLSTWLTEIFGTLSLSPL